jgi:hypothetical protein
MRLKTYKMSDRLPDYRLDPPEDRDLPDCPECGAAVEEITRDEVYRCTNEECGHEEAMPEDPRISAYEDRMSDVDWDYEGP